MDFFFGFFAIQHLPFWAFQGTAWGRYPPPTQRARPFEPFPGELEEEATAVAHFGLTGEAGDPPVCVEQVSRQAANHWPKGIGPAPPRTAVCRTP